MLDRAKNVHKDDYSNLLPFYNYDLKTTAGDKAELDSVIYKAKTGIVLHDLRNDWIDDLYLLVGTRPITCRNNTIQRTRCSSLSTMLLPIKKKMVITATSAAGWMAIPPERIIYQRRTDIFPKA